MKTIVYEKVLRNFNKIVQEKYPNAVGMRVSEMPWQDWWKQCEAAPSGQNKVQGYLMFTDDSFLPNIVYDDFPFLDDLSKVEYLAVIFRNNVDYSVLPSVDLINRIFIDINDAVSTADISQLQTPLMNMKTDCHGDISIRLPESCKLIGELKLTRFTGTFEAPLVNNTAKFIIPNGNYQYYDSKHNAGGRMILVDEEIELPYIEAKSIELLTPLLLTRGDVFVSHFKSKELWIQDFYLSEANKTVFNDGLYEKLMIDYCSINGCNPYDVLSSFNGMLNVINSKERKESYARLEVEDLFKKYNLTYYPIKRRKEAVQNAINSRQASVSVGGF